MSARKHFETPNGKRPMRVTIIATCIIALVIAAWAWWSAAWFWRLPLLVIVGGLSGEALTRLLVRDVRRELRK